MNKKKYIEFALCCIKPKTCIFAVRNVKYQIVIGYVKWYSSWRQYCLVPEPNTVFSTGCLRDIADFLEKLNKEHHKQLTERGV